MVDYEEAAISQMMESLPVLVNHDEANLNLQGVNHTTVNRLNSLSGLSVSGDAEMVLDEALGGAGRHRQTVLQVKFKTTGDYLEIDLGSAQDWTAGNAEDDNLTFFMRAIAAFADTQFDLELRDGSNVLITNADFTVPAFTTARKPQFVNIDTSTPTLSAVRYIRIVYDGSGELILWLWDFVRTDAGCLTNAKILDLENLHGKIAGAFKAAIANNAGTEAHFHRNSLAEDGEVIDATNGLDHDNERMGWCLIHGITGDADVDLELETRSR